MNNLDMHAIKQSLEQKTTYELSEILKYTQDDYQPEVIPIIENILIDRGITKEELYDFISNYRKLKYNIGKSRFTAKSKTPWYITIIILAIGSFLYKTLINNNDFYVKNEHLNTAWTVGYRDTIMNELLYNESIQKISEKYRLPFCECYVNKLKNKYPHRITDTLNFSGVNEIATTCADSLKKVIR